MMAKNTVEMVGTESLTLLQAKALLAAAEYHLERDEQFPGDGILEPRQKQALLGAMNKLLSRVAWADR